MGPYCKVTNFFEFDCEVDYSPASVLKPQFQLKSESCTAVCHVH